MAAVNAAPVVSLTHVSTFSGAGGTCLGFRLAGFRTLWANDIEPHARACYALNLSSPIDGRDIRLLSAADILAATGLAEGELDVFEGSPPCTTFSTAGRREKSWHRTREHAGHVQQNIEDLFFDWLRLLEGLRPRAFMAENVAGLIKGVAKGYFKDIVRRMKGLGYQTEVQVVDAQWLGVPQQRARVIFLGIREDLQLRPRFPMPFGYRYSVREALPWVDHVEHDTSGLFSQGNITDRPSPAITVGVKSLCSSHFKVHHLEGGFSEIDVTNRPSRTLTNQSKLHLIQQIVGNDRFEPRFGTLEIPSPTIMAAGARTSGEIRNGELRRKFTIAEVKRICSFPDDYQMTGTYQQQWARLGNSVPPLMAFALAQSLREVLLPTAAEGIA
jgi:DNA (cytosine-5)-methyltransferase 1